MSNNNLNISRTNNNDEFYTLLSDIEEELKHYSNSFKNKTIYCNCDNPYTSNFLKYFKAHFTELGLKRLIATNYAPQNLFEENEEKPYYLDTDKNNEISILGGDGDFRSAECLALLKQSDIVVTNPPFSLFREFISLLTQYKKEFIIVGNKNAYYYQEVFNLFKENKLFLGCEKISNFITPEGHTESLRNLCRWFTNIEVEKELKSIPLKEKFSSGNYPVYDNFNAIEVKEVGLIPRDYDGIMGVPVTFLDKYNPRQFELLGESGDLDWAQEKCEFFTPPSEELQKQYRRADISWRVQNPYYLKEGKIVKVYSRIFIRRK